MCSLSTALEGDSQVRLRVIDCRVAHRRRFKSTVLFFRAVVVDPVPLRCYWKKKKALELPKVYLAVVDIIVFLSSALENKQKSRSTSFLYMCISSEEARDVNESLSQEKRKGETVHFDA